MKNLRILLLLLSALCLPAPIIATAQEATAAVEALPHPEVVRIEPAELKRLIDEKADIVVVDTRDSLSYDYGHVPGAINIYYDPTGDPTTREMTLVALPMDKMIALYCP